MPKRAISPELQPPAKRIHNENHEAFVNLPASFDQLYDEVVLVIFSYLSYKDLCMIQPTSQNWARLALDNQVLRYLLPLWKRLYLVEYGKARLRGSRGFIGRHDGREIKPLPGRAKLQPTEDIRDWKWMFRISSNWKTGRCAVEPLLAEGVGDSLSSESPGTPTIRPHTSILLTGPLAITSSTNDQQPSLLLVGPDRTPNVLSCKTPRSGGDTVVSCLALDQSPPTGPYHARLAAFLSTGEFMIYSIDHYHPANSKRICSYLPSVSTPRLSPIYHAVLHKHFVVTLSASFHISLYDLSSGSIVHAQTLSSFTSHLPSSMVLTTISPTTYKLIIAYTVPVYPAHWSVAATELIISSELGSVSVTSSRSARAFDVPMGWIDEQKIRVMREQWARKAVRVADMQTDGKWVVLAPAEAPPATSTTSYAGGLVSSHTASSLNSLSYLQLYRLSFPSSTSSPKLSFVRALYGQVGPCSALSLADGRCVSLGVNGSLWVWDLEGDTGTELDQGHSSTRMAEATGSVTAVKGTVVFDERKIISAGTNGMEVRRFDI
ncbi:hypothetical protein BDW22DRAFT_1391820 [Trametopsis cervina]|nr:hypothetical protein BDW22DRAFT_1391820 [Trametopsis cervina]